MLLISKENFKKNIYEFKSNEKNYFYLGNKTHVFDLDNVSKNVFNSIREHHGDVMSFEELSSLHPEINYDILKNFTESLIAVINYTPSLVEPIINIKGLSITTSNTCNLKCMYCYQKDTKKEMSPMNFKTVKEALKMFVDKKPIFNVEFIGGEALIEFELIKKTVEYCEINYPKTKFQYSMFTNGTLLTDEIIEFLRRYNFSIILSVDGPIEIRQNNQIKHKNCLSNEFDHKIKKLISCIKPENILSLTVITKENYDLNIIVPYLYELGFKRITFSPATSPNIEETNKTMNLWLKNKNEFINKSENEKYLEIFEEIKIYNERIDNQYKTNFLCEAGINILSINTFGEFYFCNRFNDNKKFKLGSVKDGFDYESAKSYVSKSLNKRESIECSSCWARNICPGGCKARNYLENRKIDKVASFFCKYMRDVIDYSLKNYVSQERRRDD